MNWLGEIFKSLFGLIGTVFKWCIIFLIVIACLNSLGTIVL